MDTNKHSIEVKKLSLQHNPFILAFHPEDARKIFADPNTAPNKLDALFLKKISLLHVIYESIQRYFTGSASREKYYPGMEEIIRDLISYKRGINSRLPTPSQEEFIESCLLLAGQETPFIHILREMSINNAQINFATGLVVPTKKNEKKIISAYQDIFNTTGGLLRDFVKKSSLSDFYLQSLKNSFQAFKANTKIGRADFELRKMYLDEYFVTGIENHILRYLKHVNEIIHQKIYKPVLDAGIQNKLLISLDCSDIRSNLHSENHTMYDIVHFRKPEYIQERYHLLGGFLQPELFGEWWEDTKLRSLIQNKNAGNLGQEQYYYKTAQILYKRMAQNEEAIPFNLIQLTVEIIKLYQWQSQNIVETKRSAKEQELNLFLSNVKKTNNIYKVRNRKWIQDNLHEVRQMLRSKVPGILACTDPYVPPENIDESFNPIELNLDIYLLVKDRKTTANAVDTVALLYRQNHDILLLRVMENLLSIHHIDKKKIKEYLAPAYYDKLYELIVRSYQHQLPWWSQIWLLLFNRKIANKKIKKMRTSLELSQRTQAEKILKKKKKTTFTLPNTIFGHPTPTNMGRKSNDISQELGHQELLGKICQFMDYRWENQRYPSSDDIISSMPYSARKETEKIINLASLGAVSVREIVSISADTMGNIYASRGYLKKNLNELIDYLGNYINKKEETYTIGDKTYIAKNTYKKETSKAILKYLKTEMQ